MNSIGKMIFLIGAAALCSGCESPSGEARSQDFKYTIDTFADLKVPLQT